MKKILIATLFLIPTLAFAVSTIVPYNYQAYDIRNGLVQGWSFDGKDYVGGRAQNYVTGGSTGFFSGIATSTFYRPGRIGQGINLDGVNDFMNTALTSETTFQDTTFTVALWAKVASTTYTSSVLFSKNASPANPSGGFAINLGATGFLSVLMRTAVAGTAYSRTTLTGGMQDNRWHHHVAICTTSTTVISNNTCSFYTDGTSNTAVSETQTAVYAGTAVGVRVGVRNFVSSAQSAFQGIVDDVRIYNRALTDAEVVQLYKFGRQKLQTTSNYKWILKNI